MSATVKQLYENGMDLDTLYTVSRRATEENLPYLKSMLDNPNVKHEDIPNLLTTISSTLRDSGEETHNLTKMLLEHEMKSPSADGLNKVNDYIYTINKQLNWAKEGRSIDLPDIKLAEKLCLEGCTFEQVKALSETKVERINELANNPNIDKARLAELSSSFDNVAVSNKNMSLANQIVDDILATSESINIEPYAKVLRTVDYMRSMDAKSEGAAFLTSLYNDKMDINTIAKFADELKDSSKHLSVAKELYGDSRVKDKSKIFDIAKDIDNAKYTYERVTGPIDPERDIYRINLYKKAQHIVFEEPALAAVYRQHDVDLEQIIAKYNELGMKDIIH